jgi:hypothetical protein
MEKVPSSVCKAILQVLAAWSNIFPKNRNYND